MSFVNDESFLSFSIETKECLAELEHMILLVRDKGSCSWQVDTITVEDVQHDTSYDFNFFCSLESSFKTRMYMAPSIKPFLPTFVFKCVGAFIKYHNWISAFGRFNSVLEVSNTLHFILVFIIFLQSFFLGLIKETTEPRNEQMFLLRTDTFIILYLCATTLIPDLLIHATKNRNHFNKNVWNYESLPKSKHLLPQPKSNQLADWLDSLERLDQEQIEKLDNEFEEPQFDQSSREIDLTEGDVISVDSLELETLTEQRLSAISNQFSLTPAGIVDIEDPDASDTMSWMSFYDQESPFFTISNLEKYTQFTTLFQPFKPRQLVRNRISLWIQLLQKWHKVQLRAVRTYRLLYAFWWRWQVLDIDMSLLQQEMNKMQVLVLQFQNTGQRIRDMSVWLEQHPLWRVAIEQPKDEEMIAPYEQMIELLEHVVVHVMSNFLDHYNTIQRHRKLSRDIEWFIEDWFRELLDTFLASGYLNKSEIGSEETNTESHYWLPPKLVNRQYPEIDNVIRVVPVSRLLDNYDEPFKRSFADVKVIQVWHAWLPHFIREIGEHIIEEMEKRNLGLSLVDSIVYIQMQREDCLWEAACVKIMGIIADVILCDIVKYMCVFLPEMTKKVMLQRSRAFLADCLIESGKPWSTLVELGDELDTHHRYMLISILKGCVARCKAVPLSSHDVSNDNPIMRANKMRLLFLLPDELQASDLRSEKLIPRMNTILVNVIEKFDQLKSCVGLIRSQFDLNLSQQAAAKDRVRKVAVAGIVNTLLTLCRLEMMISHMELCRDAIDLDIPATSMIGSYNRINFRQVFRLLASHYGQSRLGKRSIHPSVRKGSTRIHNVGTVMLERRPKDFDVDVIQLLLHPWIPPLHYVWGLLARLVLTIEIVCLPAFILEMSTRLSESSVLSVFIVMGIGALMDFIFIQPLKCFLIVLWQRYWEKKGVYYVYQKYPFTC
uniref:Uncharacterized protein n=1 Tax=Strigamia maritima TaxID=126957 RepID=T1JEC1_STRMM